LPFDRKTEAVGAVDPLMLKVPADGVGFLGIDGLHDQRPVVPPAKETGSGSLPCRGKVNLTPFSFDVGGEYRRNM
jgi:hypothetical protein